MGEIAQKTIKLEQYPPLNRLNLSNFTKNMAKQVMDIAPSAGITSAQSDEHQRNWDEAQWEHAAAEGNYDRSREGLNFEIHDGREQPVDRSENLPARMARCLAAAGIQDPNLKPASARRGQSRGNSTPW